jgi:hypothetical protein
MFFKAIRITGMYTGEDTQSHDGVVTTESLTANYSVAPNCTVTATVTVGGMSVSSADSLGTRSHLYGNPTKTGEVGPGSTNSSGLAFGLHRLLIPQADGISVWIAQLGSVTPEHFLRWMGEVKAFTGHLLERLLHIIDLEGQRQTGRMRSYRILYKENREIELILKRHSTTFWHFEFDPKA